LKLYLIKNVKPKRGFFQSITGIGDVKLLADSNDLSLALNLVQRDYVQEWKRAF
jgi:hypothetical protein